MLDFILFNPAVALAFYGGLAGMAVWATWHDFDLKPVGIALAFCYIVTNLIGLTVPVPSQPGPYSAIQILIAAMAVHAWGEHRSRRLIALVCVSLASVGANIAFVLNFPPDQRQIFLWELTTNMCFAGECLLASWLGIAHGYRIGRFAHRVRLDRGLAQPDAAREIDP